MIRVMIVGATGVFGSRLVEQLAHTGSYDLVLATRDAAKAQPLLKRLRGTSSGAHIVVFDRNAPDVQKLREIAPDILVDAAGPFQLGDMRLAEACIAAGIHYLDLADARAFVAGIPKLDASARSAGVAVITGASSTPALSHAVLDEFTRGWKRRDTIFAAIAPGNRAPRGLAVIQAILSYVGEPVQVFRGGQWTTALGWGDDQRVEIDGVGTRHVAVCETPDQDLFIDRYRPLVSAEFKAGLELFPLHGGLRLASWLRARRLLPRLTPLAGLMRFLAGLLERLGTDLGGMTVSATGRDAANRPVALRWSLAAPGGIGPNIPVIPALALIERFAAGPRPSPGARSAAGELRYGELAIHLKRIGASLNLSLEPAGAPHLFERALGPAWPMLPPVTRRLHTTDPTIILDGEADVSGAANAAGRLIARLFGLPVAGKGQPVRVVIARDGDRELWARHYPGRVMKSVMTAADPAAHTLEEHFGSFRFRLRLEADSRGIDMVPEAAFWRSVPLPRAFLPAVTARERASADGRHLFDVEIAMKPFGRLVHYRGWLRPVSPE